MAHEDSDLITGQILELNSGDIIDGTYRIQSKLGIGSMGVVYRAEDMKLRRTVSMKFLNPVIADSPEVVELFRSEARALARLNHPGIVQVYTLGQEKGVLYFVMEYIPGETLAARIAVTGQMQPEQAYPMLRQISEALDVSHTAGMIHRDLKPANVMILANDRVKVMDFGLAGVAATATGRAVGTPRYMAPEQAQGMKIDARADLYALGIMTYELLVGDVPFEGANYRQTLEMQVSSPVPSARARRPHIPRDWDLFIKDLLAKNPDDRPEKAADVIKRLDVMMKKGPSESPEDKDDPKAEAEKIYQKARAHFEIKEYPVAKSLLREVFELNANHGKAWNLQGAIDLRQNRFPEASKAFAKSFALIPDFFEAALNLGIALQKQKRFAEAIWAFDHAAKLMPSVATTWVYLGEAKLALRDLPGAKKVWTRALELDPTNANLKKRFDELKRAMAI